VRYHADVNKMAPFIYAFMGVLLVLFACTLFSTSPTRLPIRFSSASLSA